MPEENIRIRPDARLLESKTHFQRNYTWKSNALSQNRMEPSKIMDRLSNKSPGGLDDMTSYRREFGKDPTGKNSRYLKMLHKAQSVDAFQGSRRQQPSAYS